MTLIKNIIWSPQPKQAVFMSRGEWEALYGGAMGGGKSDALVMEALRQVHLPHYRGIIIRKTFPQLSKLIDKSQEHYKRAYPKAKYNGSNHVWTFPSGAKIYFGSMQHANDRFNYQGIDYEYIAFDELTHFTFDEYSYMWTRNRPNGPGSMCYIRATSNPGGVGHGWVKERFIIPAKPYTTIMEEVKYKKPGGQLVREYKSRIFIPATVFDNQKLLENDPGYVGRLAHLPEKEKNAALYGDWNTFAGQVFTEWRNNPEEYQTRVMTHVIEDDPRDVSKFKIQPNWRLYCGHDWGGSKPFSVGWFAVDEDGRIYHFKEFYGWNGVPDVGIKMTIPEIAREIRRMEEEDPRLRGKFITRIADDAIFHELGGESQAQVYARCGIYWEKADKSRVPGWSQLHDRLRFDENGIPMFYVTTACPNFIRTFPILIHSLTRPEDVDTSQEDHAADMVRYVCMANPFKAPLLPTPAKIITSDPLNQLQPRKNIVYL